MHELAITQSVVDAVCERAGARPVRSVKVRVGALTAVVPDAMMFCFELAAEGTVADGARLEIEHSPAAGRCRDCGDGFPLSDLILLCPCGSANVEVTAGRELQILSMEVG
jgi:hydrogenase nickel incorporation protein HypA/HybF